MNISANKTFWEWFSVNEKHFVDVVKQKNNIENELFELLSSNLTHFRDGLSFLVGIDDNKVELIFTAGGDIANLVLIEELINEAPKLENWKFNTLNTSDNDISINYDEYTFESNYLHFFEVIEDEYLDEVNIVVLYKFYTKKDHFKIQNGIGLYLENLIGEKAFSSIIDEFNVGSLEKNKVQHIIPIVQLGEYLNKRNESIIHKNENIYYDSTDDNFTFFENEVEDEEKLYAEINTDLLNWKYKSSHPWILTVKINFEQSEDNGLETDEFLDILQNNISELFSEKAGIVYLGRQTTENLREIFWVCKEYKSPCILIEKMNNNLQIDNFPLLDYVIYKDKYWRTFEHFCIE